MRRRNEIEKCDLEGIVLVTHYDLFDASTILTAIFLKKEMSKMIRDRTTIDGTHGEDFYRKKVYHN